MGSIIPALALNPCFGTYTLFDFGEYNTPELQVSSTVNELYDSSLFKVNFPLY